MYNNKVRYILKDKSGNTVGAEVEFNGNILKLSTAELKLKQPIFTNATVDKNGHVRAKVGNLPKKELIPPTRVVTPTIQASACEYNLYEEKVFKGLQIGVGTAYNVIVDILIEDKASGFELYCKLIKHWIEKESRLLNSTLFNIITTEGKDAMLKALKGTLVEKSQCCVVIIDSAGAYSSKVTKSHLVEQIKDELENLNKRSKRAILFTPLSTEFCISCFGLLRSDLNSPNCHSVAPNWFLGFLTDIERSYKDRTAYIAWNAMAGEFEFMGGKYNRYVLELIGANKDLPNIENQIYYIINYGLQNTYFKYTKGRLNGCYCNDCCIHGIPKNSSSNKCGKTLYGLNKKDYWIRNLCINLLFKMLYSIFSHTEYTPYYIKDIENIVY